MIEAANLSVTSDDPDALSNLMEQKSVFATLIKTNAKILLALLLCVSFLTAATFDERANAEIQEKNNHTHIQIYANPSAE